MPEIITAVAAVTPLVLAAKSALVAFAATVTLAGTCPAALSLVSDTAMPPVGAGPLRVTVPVEEFPPITLIGFSVTDDNVETAVTARATVIVMGKSCVADDVSVR